MGINENGNEHKSLSVDESIEERVYRSKEGP